MDDVGGWQSDQQSEKRCEPGEYVLDMADSFRPDVVLLDMSSNESYCLELAKRLTAKRPNHTPLIIAISGYGPQKLAERSENNGIDLYLSKPFDPDYLRVILNRFKKMMEGIAAA